MHKYHSEFYVSSKGLPTSNKYCNMNWFAQNAFVLHRQELEFSGHRFCHEFICLCLLVIGGKSEVSPKGSLVQYYITCN